jgi:hypothetical protein
VTLSAATVFFNQFGKLLKEIAGIVGPGAASGWYCTLKSVALYVASPRRLIVEIDVRHFTFPGSDSASTAKP